MWIILISVHMSIMKFHKNMRIFTRCRNCSNKVNKYHKLAVLRISHRCHHLLMREVNSPTFYTLRIISKCKMKMFIPIWHLRIMSTYKIFTSIKCTWAQSILPTRISNKQQAHKMHILLMNKLVIKTTNMIKNLSSQ